MIDLFSEGITIKVKKDPKVKTNVGCVLTFILILLVIAYAIFALVNMTKRDVVFTTFSTQFANSLNDPALGTLSSSAVPLEAAHIITNISWYTDNTKATPLDSAPFGDTSFTNTAWNGLDFTCSPVMQKNLIKKGYDLKNVICVKIDNYVNASQELEIVSLNRNGNYFTYNLQKVCRLAPKLELQNYQTPYDWSLVCQKVTFEVTKDVALLSSFYYVKYVSLDTDDSYIGANSNREYVRYLDIRKDYENGLSAKSFRVGLKFFPKFDNISRKFQKLTDVIAAINGIYGLILLVLIILGKSCVDVEQRAKLFRYLSSKKDLGLKDSNISTWDIFNAKLFRNKQAQEKVNEMNRFFVANIEDKLELSNIANFETPIVNINGPKTPEEKSLLHVKVVPMN